MLLPLVGARFTTSHDSPFTFGIEVADNGRLRSYTFAADSEMQSVRWVWELERLGVERRAPDLSEGNASSIQGAAGTPSHAPGDGEGCDGEVAMLSPRESIILWLDNELQRGVSEELDSPLMFRGERGDAAAKIQAAVRGRAARLEFTDTIQTALVLRAAREQMEAALLRASATQHPALASQSSGGSFKGRSPKNSPKNTPTKKSVRNPGLPASMSPGLPASISPSKSSSPTKRKAPPRNQPPNDGIGSIAGAPAPGDHARAQRAKAFSLPTQFVGNTVRGQPMQLSDETPALSRYATTADRVKLLHALARVQVSGSSSDDFVDEYGIPQSSKYLRLARAQHWRHCPSCQHAVEHRDADGSATCMRCDKTFRWVAAEPVVPVSSLRQLRIETNWQYQEMTWACGSVTTRDVARLYWLSSWTPLTRGAGIELLLWRVAISAPLALSLPFLHRAARARNRRLRNTLEPVTQYGSDDGDLTTNISHTSSTLFSKTSFGTDAEPYPLVLSLPGERASSPRAKSRYFANRSRVALRAKPDPPSTRVTKTDEEVVW